MYTYNTRLVELLLSEPGNPLIFIQWALGPDRVATWDKELNRERYYRPYIGPWERVIDGDSWHGTRDASGPFSIPREMVLSKFFTGNYVE